MAREKKDLCIGSPIMITVYSYMKRSVKFGIKMKVLPAQDASHISISLPVELLTSFQSFAHFETLIVKEMWMWKALGHGLRSTGDSSVTGVCMQNRGTAIQGMFWLWMSEDRFSGEGIKEKYPNSFAKIRIPLRASLHYRNQICLSVTSKI